MNNNNTEVLNILINIYNGGSSSFIDVNTSDLMELLVRVLPLYCG